jgi:uncharacterized membrane protein
MDWGQFAIQWLHILAGTFWFGGMLFANFIVVPAVLALPADGQAATLRALGARGNRIMPWVAGATIVLGFIRGIAFGDIASVSDLGTTYGIEWLIGLVAAGATFAWGQWVTGPSAERVTAGHASPQEVGRVRLYALLELLGFFVIFTMMILMHFAGEA